MKESLLFLLLLATVTMKVYSQEINPTVFSLSASEFANNQWDIPTKRMEKATTFKITGINPLRYRYYINNIAVSQFMDNSSSLVTLGTISVGGGMIVRDVKLPEIFSTDTSKSIVRARLIDLQSKRKVTSDSISDISFKIKEMYAELRKGVNFNNIDNDRYQSINDSLDRIIAKNKDYTKLISRQNNWIAKRDLQIKEYLSYIYRLPIMGIENPLMSEYRNLQTFGPDIISEINRIKSNFAKSFESHQASFEFIESYLLKIENNPHYGSIGAGVTDYEKFQQLLQQNRFIWTKPEYGDIHGILLKESINSLREQILDKRFQLYQDFVLLVATKIGMLTQTMVMENTSYHNKLVNYKWIDPTIFEKNIQATEELQAKLKFVKQTSSELQVLMSYLDVNLSLYERIAKQINENFLVLLPYLKDMEFITQPNTTEALMPISTNFKNVDLIRYTVKREDIILKSTESVEYDYWIDKGLKVDFSVGFLGSMLIDQLYNKVLISTNKDDIDSIHIVKQNTGKADFAFGGMVNVVKRNGNKWFNLGGSFGVAYSTNKSLQFLAGLGLHIGKTERLILHAGVAFGQTKRLDTSANNFLTNENNIILNSKDVKFASYNIPYYQKFDIKPFFGISYNLSKKNALQAVSNVGMSTYSENFPK